MISFFTGLIEAIRVVPEIIKVYLAIVRAVGEIKAAAFAEDIARVSKLVEATRDPKLSFEEKRKLRAAALKEGADLWERSLQ